LLPDQQNLRRGGTPVLFVGDMLRFVFPFCGAAAVFFFGACSSGTEQALGPAGPVVSTPEGGPDEPDAASSGAPDAAPSPDGASTPPKVYTTIAALVTSKADLAASLYPIAVGLKWTYQIDPGITTCSGGSRTIAVRAKSTENGQDYFAVDTPCDYFAAGANRVWVVGDAVFSQVATGAASKQLSPPLTDGATWAMNSAVTGAWVRELAPVKVAAGTFDDCWSVKTVVFGGSLSTFCRGVGVVRTSSSATNGGTGFGSELTSYDFSALP
jgi:hypothetical protein